MARDGLTTLVDKERLLTALRENREGHAAEYEKAKKGYLRVTRKRLEELLARLVDGELLDRVWLEAPPEDHTKDYDDAIEMMEWTQDNQIDLTQAQFKQYVKDDWGWRDQWMTSNTAYLEAGS
jgi:hypothetical protein